MKKITLEFDGWSVIRSTDGNISFTHNCQDNGKVGKRIRKCLRCHKEPPKDALVTADMLGYFNRDINGPLSGDTLGEILDEFYSEQYFEVPKEMSAPIYKMLAKTNK